MTTTVIDAEFKLKLASLRAELGSVPGMTESSARKAVKAWTGQWKAAEAASSSTLQKLKKDSGAIGKVAEMLGGQWGTALRMLKGGSELAVDGLSSTTLAAGAAVVGVMAAVAAVAALGSVVVSTTSNIETLSASLSDQQREALEPQIEAIERAKAEQDKLSQAWTAAKITLTAEYAPALEDLYTILGSAIGATSDLTKEQENQRALNLKMTGPLYGYKLLWDQVTASLHASAEELRAFRETEDELIARKAGGAQFSMASDAMAELLGMPTNSTAGVDDSKRQAASDKAEARARAKVQAVFDLAREADAGVASIFAEIETEITAAMEAIGQAGVDAVMAEADAAATQSMRLLKIKRDEVDAIKAANAEIKADNDAVHRQRMDAAQTALSTTAAFMNTMGGLAEELTQRQVDATTEGTRAHREALLKQFKIWKGVAIAQAAINTALGFTTELSKGGVVGIITGALVLAAGAVEIGLIASKQPPSVYHTGGMVQSANRAPDEVDTRLLAGEGVLNRAAMARLGAQGLHQMNRGGGGGGAPITVPVYGHKVFDAVTTNAANRRQSPYARALRSVQSTRVGHLAR